MINAAMAAAVRDCDDGLQEWSQANPHSAEARAITDAAAAAARAGVAVYFVHVSGRLALDALTSLPTGTSRVYARARTIFSIQRRRTARSSSARRCRGPADQAAL